MSRLANTKKNIVFGYISNILSLLFGFGSRTVFIYFLGTTYLGLNGLFLNLLSILSLAELGIGSAMTYALYKPVAQEDYSKVKGILKLYKQIYRKIAISILLLGILVMPFLNYMIKDVGSITYGEIILYYSFFLINSSSSYLVSYKYSLFQAQQKSYISSNIDLVVGLITTIIQMILIYIYRDYLVYLIVGFAINIISKILILKYISMKTVFLSSYEVEEINKDEYSEIKRNIKSLVFHKVGEVSIHQTDNIIISSIVGITFVGLLSNYMLIINTVSKFINVAISSVIGSLGNLIASKTKTKQYEIFKIYRFVAFWIYGFSTIAFWILIQSFVSLWIGYEFQLPNITIAIILCNFYLMGHRIILNNFKKAAGIFFRDRFLSLTEAAVNLIISIILAFQIGLVGVFIGTLLSGLITSIVRPLIIYKELFDVSPKKYFKDSIVFIFVTVMSLVIMLGIQNALIIDNLIIKFIVMVIITSILPNLIFFLFFNKRDEFKYIINVTLK
jgi:O-antigen/teichoic acid export membrane protein